MNFNRRQFLAALGGMIAATGIDPSSIIKELEHAPIEKIKEVLSGYTIKIGAMTFPLLKMIGPRVSRPIIDWTAGASGCEEAVLGALQIEPAEVEIGAIGESLFLHINDEELLDVEVRLGYDGPLWSFQGRISHAEVNLDTETSLVSLVPIGLVTMK